MSRARWPTAALLATLLVTLGAAWRLSAGVTQRVQRFLDGQALAVGERMRARLLLDAARAQATASFLVGASAHGGSAPAALEAGSWSALPDVPDGGVAIGIARRVPGSTPSAPVVALVPPGRGAGVLGQELMAEPRRRATLERACARGAPTLSPPVPLLAQPGQPPPNGLLVVVPVYGTDAALSMRPGAPCWGFVHVAVPARALEDEVAPRIAGLAVEILESDATEASPSALAGGGGASVAHASAGGRQYIEILERTFLVLVFERGRLDETADRWFPAAVGLVGIGLAILLYRVVAAQVTARHLAEVALVRSREEQAARERALTAERDARETLGVVSDAGRSFARALDPRTVAQLVARVVVETCHVGVAVVRWRGQVVAWEGAGGERPAEADVTAFAAGSEARFAARASARVEGEQGLDLELLAGWSASDPPAERTRGVLDGLAGQAAVALANASSFAHAQELVTDLERSNRALARSNRELDLFAYAASHDLRAPLRAIGNLADWIEEELEDRLTEPARAHLARLRGRVVRLEHLIESLLEFARAGRDLGSVTFESRRIVEAVVRELGRLPEGRVLLEGELPALRGDPLVFRQVVHNLVENAFKHGGRGNLTVRIRGEARGDEWDFVVDDDGGGIAPEFHERVFQLFETLLPRDRVDGSGMGLALVRKLVEAQGGRTWVESEPGAGARFHFTWPRGVDNRA